MRTRLSAQRATTNGSRARSSPRPTRSIEDERFGERRGDELPEQLATGEGRARWLAEAKRRLEQQRAEQARPIPAARPQRLRESKRRLEEELETDVERMRPMRP